MPRIERAPGGASFIDVLDRVLDKGIIIDAWVRVSLVGIDLITVEAHVVVASIDTYLRHADTLGLMVPFARPSALGGPGEELAAGEEATRHREGGRQPGERAQERAPEQAPRRTGARPRSRPPAEPPPEHQPQRGG